MDGMLPNLRIRILVRTEFSVFFVEIGSRRKVRPGCSGFPWLARMEKYGELQLFLPVDKGGICHLSACMSVERVSFLTIVARTGVPVRFKSKLRETHAR
jgi:hypothetical protein